MGVRDVVLDVVDFDLDALEREAPDREELDREAAFFTLLRLLPRAALELLDFDLVPRLLRPRAAGFFADFFFVVVFFLFAAIGYLPIC